MLVMTAKAKQKKAAAEFIRFILSDQQAVEFFYQSSNQMTTGRMDLLTTGAMGQDAYVQAFTKAMAVSNPLAMRHVQSNAMMDALAPAIQSIVKGADIDAELQKVDRAIERLQSR